MHAAPLGGEVASGPMAGTLQGRLQPPRAVDRKLRRHNWSSLASLTEAATLAPQVDSGFAADFASIHVLRTATTGAFGGEGSVLSARRSPMAFRQESPRWTQHAPVQIGTASASATHVAVASGPAPSNVPQGVPLGGFTALAGALTAGSVPSYGVGPSLDRVTAAPLSLTPPSAPALGNVVPIGSVR